MLIRVSALSWVEGGAAATGVRVVIIKNVFERGEVRTAEDKQELMTDILAECTQRCGRVEKVSVFEVRDCGCGARLSSRSTTRRALWRSSSVSPKLRSAAST